MSDGQLFVAGEIVIIEFKHLQHSHYLNGSETQILEAKFGTSLGVVTGLKSYGWHYLCDMQPIDDDDSWWHQSALRKKHEGCGRSLEKVISLCTKQTVGM